MLLWTILIGLFYLLKPFFLLIFETFLITYITKGTVQRCVRRLHLNYRLAAVFVFALFVSLLFAAGAWIVPQLILESRQILSEFAGDREPQTEQVVARLVEGLVVKIVGQDSAQAVIGSEQYAASMGALRSEAARAVKAALPRVLNTLLHLAKLGWEILIFSVLAIVLSFILVMDWQRIGAKLKDLENSRIRTFYLGAAPHLLAFADILGKAFRAQAIIASVNTILTATALWYFEVPSIALLSTLVFLCGFIPIAGSFLSSIPILLFGAQAGGLPLALKLVAFIAGIHALEAYVLNPKITGNALHVHPILVLILLLIGERFFGIWGMVVGVPIGYYVISVLTARDERLATDAADSVSG
jgi:predicted PurR-regulated permease PerM